MSHQKHKSMRTPTIVRAITTVGVDHQEKKLHFRFTSTIARPICLLHGRNLPFAQFSSACQAFLYHPLLPLLPKLKVRPANSPTKRTELAVE